MSSVEELNELKLRAMNPVHCLLSYSFFPFVSATRGLWLRCVLGCLRNGWSC